MTKTTWRMVGCMKDGDRWVFRQERADSDLAALKAIHEKQVEQYGASVVGDFPKLLERPVVVALVAERGGEIVDGAYGEAQVEWCHIGCDSHAAAALRRWKDAMLSLFKKRGFRFVRTFVPRAVEQPVGKELRRAGFTQQDEVYSSFLLDLRGMEK